MKLKKVLQSLVERDSKIAHIPQFILGGTDLDLNHTQRRMQQRAISSNMISVALAYGKNEFHSKAKTWTLLDKCLKNTPYESLTEHLRGLRVIGGLDSLQEQIFITTVYWSFDLR